MRDLIIVAAECKKELDALGIEYNRASSFQINTTSKRWGQCRMFPGGDIIITISKTLLDERNSLKGLKETILHELLHTCKGCMNHGKIWKSLAEEVNIAYGYNIKRCNSSSEKGVEYDDMQRGKRATAKYAVQCEKCGKMYTRSRMSKLIQHPEYYRCGVCGSALHRVDL